MSDWWVIRDSEGKHVTYGSYGLPDLLDDWNVFYFDTRELCEAEPDVALLLEFIAAQDTLQSIYKTDRNQALIAKAAEADRYISDHPVDPWSLPLPISLSDPACIDETTYPILYDEYWKTYDMTNWTPYDLALKIRGRAAPNETEGDLRRNKLLAEKIVEEYNNNG